MRAYWFGAWSLLYPLCRIFLGLRVRGRKHFKGVGPVILAANHSSNLDPLFLGLASPRELFFIAKEGLFEVSRSFTWLLEKFNAIPLRRGGVDLSALRKAAELLRKGQTVVLFPEGTRSKLGKFLGFKAGVGFLAIRNRIPVIPAYIYGVDNSFLSFIFDSDIRRPTDMERRAGRFKNYLLHRRRIGVEFGRPIEPRDYRAEKADYLQFTAQVNEAILGLAESLKRR